MRKYYLDNLRYFIIFLVLIFHIILVNNGFYLNVSSNPNLVYLNLISAFIYPWFMICLFMISGIVSRYYLEGHDLKTYFKARKKKLLIPSTISLFVFHFLLGIINITLSGANDSLYEVPLIIRIFITILSGIGPLWFIQVLFICSSLLVLIVKKEKGRMLKKFSDFSYLGFLILLSIFVLVWLISEDKVLSTYRFLIDILSFMIGYFILSHEKNTCKLAKISDILMVVSCFIGIIYSITYYKSDFLIEPVVSNLFSGVYSYLMSLSMISFFKKHFNKENKYNGFLSKYSYAYYVFHYFSMTLVLYLGYKLAFSNIYLNYLLVTLSGFVLPIFLANLVRLVPVLDKIILGETKHV